MRAAPDRWIEDADWLRAHVGALSAAHEAGRAAALDDQRCARRAISTAMLRAIVGFELAISQLEGKWKLSQNRDAADRAGVREGLLRDGHDDAGAADEPG